MIREGRVIVKCRCVQMCFLSYVVVVVGLSVWSSCLETAEFPLVCSINPTVSVLLHDPAKWIDAFNIMWCPPAVSADVEASILMYSALVGA